MYIIFLTFQCFKTVTSNPFVHVELHPRIGDTSKAVLLIYVSKFSGQMGTKISSLRTWYLVRVLNMLFLNSPLNKAVPVLSSLTVLLPPHKDIIITTYPMPFPLGNCLNYLFFISFYLQLLHGTKGKKTKQSLFLSFIIITSK